MLIRRATAIRLLSTFLFAAAFLRLTSAEAAVHAVNAIGLTVSNLEQQVQFFTQVLHFEKENDTVSVPKADDELLGLPDTRFRTAALRLGTERITLTEHLNRPGRPIPADSRSFDHWFQHIAIVVSDMDRAYEHLRRARVRHVSTAPQTLPAWNKDAGGLRAFYFRGPEDHVLEIIWYPRGKGALKWQPPADEQARPRPLFLGIDHTAIVVSDTDRSLAFYTNVLGLRIVGQSENHGTEQEHLNQVFGARLRITALRAEHGPGVEFLEYLTPPGGRPLPADATPYDLTFWRIHLLADHPDFLAKAGTSALGRRVSSSRARDSLIIRDSDGHALQLEVASGLIRRPPAAVPPPAHND